MFYITHIYSFSGKLYPSVTTVLSACYPVPEALAAWKLRTGKDGVEKMRAAQVVGTLSHYRILNKLSPSLLDPPEFNPDTLPKDAMELVDLAEIMFDELKLDIGYPRKIEKLLFSKEYCFCGTPDLCAPIDGVYTLVDLKTSKDLHETHKLQLGGYHELLGRTPERGMLISIHPHTYQNKFLRAHTHVIERGDLDEYADKFLVYAKEFHKRNLIEKLASEHGIMNEFKTVIGND